MYEINAAYPSRSLLAAGSLPDAGCGDVKQPQAFFAPLPPQAERLQRVSTQLSGLIHRQQQLESSMQQRPTGTQVKRSGQARAADCQLVLTLSRQANQLQHSIGSLLQQMKPGLQGLQATMQPAAARSMLAPLQLEASSLSVATAHPETSKPGWDTEDQGIDSAFWNGLVDTIGETSKSNKKLSDVVEGFVGYFNEMSGFLYTDHVSVITSGDDKGKYSVDYSGMHNDYWNNHARKWDGRVICEGVTQDEYDSIGQKLFGSDYKNWIQLDGDKIKMNVSSYTKDGVEYKNPVNDAMYKRLIDNDLKGTMEAQEISTWEQQFDAQRTVLSNMSNDMAQKLSRANSIFDNVVKVLSSTINSMLEIDKAYMKW